MSVDIVICPRCGRTVRDFHRAFQAHGRSCVKIPDNRPKGWGVKRG